MSDSTVRDSIKQLNYAAGRGEPLRVLAKLCRELKADVFLSSTELDAHRCHDILDIGEHEFQCDKVFGHAGPHAHATSDAYGDGEIPWYQVSWERRASKEGDMPHVHAPDAFRERFLALTEAYCGSPCHGDVDAYRQKVEYIKACLKLACDMKDAAQ